MSKEAAKNFFKLIESNKEVAQKMHVMKNLLECDDFDDEIVINKIILLAKEHGFDFTSDEFIEYCSSYITELSDDDLLNVSGGLSTPQSVAVGLALVFGTAVCATTAVNVLHAVSESPSLISRLAAAPEKHHRYVPPQKAAHCRMPRPNRENKHTSSTDGRRHRPPPGQHAPPPSNDHRRAPPPGTQ